MISNPLVYQSWLIQSVDMACSMYWHEHRNAHAFKPTRLAL